jgi:hypothetical protein
MISGNIPPDKIHSLTTPYLIFPLLQLLLTHQYMLDAGLPAGQCRNYCSPSRCQNNSGICSKRAAKDGRQYVRAWRIHDTEHSGRRTSSYNRGTPRETNKTSLSTIGTATISTTSLSVVHSQAKSPDHHGRFQAITVVANPLDRPGGRCFMPCIHHRQEDIPQISLPTTAITTSRAPTWPFSKSASRKCSPQAYGICQAIQYEILSCSDKPLTVFRFRHRLF